MSGQGLKLKHPTGWFAAGREVSRALSLLSDGAFKLYIHLCLKVDRATGQMNASHTDLAKALGKSRRSVVAYLEELRWQGVCKTRPARNQYDEGQIEMCDVLWPYERRAPQRKPQNLAEYTAHIRQLLSSWACVRISFSPADDKLAAVLFNRQVPIEVVEQGILTGCARKYMTLITTPNSGLIVSLSYFQNAIEEAANSKTTSDYWRYLRHRVGSLEKEWIEKAGSGR